MSSSVSRAVRTGSGRRPASAAVRGRFKLIDIRQHDIQGQDVERELKREAMTFNAGVSDAHGTGLFFKGALQKRCHLFSSSTSKTRNTD